MAAECISCQYTLLHDLYILQQLACGICTAQGHVIAFLQQCAAVGLHLWLPWPSQMVQN